MGHLLVASEKFEDLIIIGISVQPSYDTVERLKSYRNLGIVWTIARDVDYIVSDKYDIRLIPTLVLIDEEGVIRNRHIGLFEEPDLSERIAEIPEFQLIMIPLLFLVLALVVVISGQLSTQRA